MDGPEPGDRLRGTPRMAGPTLTFNTDLWALLVRYGRLPVEARAWSEAEQTMGEGWVSVAWALLEPRERAQFYRSMVRCCARAGLREQRTAMADQLQKLTEEVTR